MSQRLMTRIEYAVFTLEEEIIHHLMLQTATLKRNGLLQGKLGIAIAFFEYGKYRDNPIYIDFAKELTISLPKKFDDNITRDFETGLCGFGWGVEYMKYRQFIDDSKAWPDIDEKIMDINIRRMRDLSLDAGLEGLLHYILIRLKGADNRKEVIPFDSTYLKDIHYRLQLLSERDISTGLSNLKKMFISYWDTGLLTYKPDICLFTRQLKVKNEEDILSAKLGLNNGLAGELIRMIYHLNLLVLR